MLRLIPTAAMMCLGFQTAAWTQARGDLRTTSQLAAHRVFRIGMLSDTEFFGNPVSPQDWLGAFRAGLGAAGYREGDNIEFEFRNAGRDLQKLASQAVELAALDVDVVVASSTTAAKAAKGATQKIPIVFWGAEPVSSGLVHDLDHPAGNLTGVTADDHQQQTFLAQLKEILPGLDRVAILFDPGYAPVPGLLQYAEAGARALGLSTHLVNVAAPEDLSAAFADMKRAGCRAALALNHGMFFRERATLARLAIENGVALSTPYIRNTEAGVLIGHENDFDRVWRINASYVARILNGARPGDLPVERLAAYRYGINLQTAKALGLTIPAPLVDAAAIVVRDSGTVGQKIARLDEARLVGWGENRSAVEGNVSQCAHEDDLHPRTAPEDRPVGPACCQSRSDRGHGSRSSSRSTPAI